jgi:iron complex transport system ATP-binding protein
MKIDSRLSVAELSVERGQRSILERVSLQFASGSVTAVLGPNGAGKSTLLSCMAGLLQPSLGVVDLDGTPLTALAADGRARRIAFLPQIPEISWPVDVTTLVALGRIPFRRRCSDADNEAAVRRALQATHTAQWSQRVVTTLSGGERARVLLARVLAGESDWILADEPFAGLDPAHQFEAAELLSSLASQGHGIVLTIHDLALAARIADRVVVLHRGRVVADGEPETALTPSTLREVYGIEAQWLTVRDRGVPLIAIHGRHAG